MSQRIPNSISSNELRARFLEFFRQRGHAVVPSSSLVPGDDPTLLFTNAGMVQFKDVFLGKDKREYARAASSQRCVRAGGKHNDLENVGYTARHHTFFEMLGNFSFGDYFKRDAIRFAWEFVTGKEGLSIDPARLMVTVYQTDDEAYDIWNKEVGLSADRIVRIGNHPANGKPGGGGSDNFWQMGETGPCGPCSEIFYDHGAQIPGGPPGSADADGDRWIEIWNLVFMQYDRAAIEGTFESEAAARKKLDEALRQGRVAQLTPVRGAEGRTEYRVVEYTLTPLPKPSVDTGMGLERVAAVMQGVHSNYEIDLFQGLIAAAAKATNTRDLASNSLRVIADHIRACSFLIIDGVLPANEGRGYVLRRIIRRAIRHGYQLGQTRPFFHTLAAALEQEMGGAYPELKAQRAHVERVLRQEEERFSETLTSGMKLLDEVIEKQAVVTPDPARIEVDGPAPRLRAIPGDIVFKLYDTHGFPVDLTADIARERGFAVDEAGFEAAMQVQRERARGASKFGADLRATVSIERQTEFRGYEGLTDDGRILTLLKNGAPVEALREGEEGQVILDRTPFYAESGGQVGDTGVLSGSGAQFIVRDTRKLGRAHAHIGLVTKGELKVGDPVRAEVNAELRKATALNHTATHLLHAALRRVLGSHVQQKGSLVAPDRLRFDFSHYQPVTPDEVREIERLVNAEVRANAPAETQVMPFDQAVAAGAMALFGEKYASDVRVLKVGAFSMELCGGTHVGRAGDIGLFKIVAESGVASGVRRIEALTGEGALSWVEAGEALVREVAAQVRGNRDDLRDKVGQLIEKNRQFEKEIQQLKSKLASGGRSTANRQEVTVASARSPSQSPFKVVVEVHEELDVPTLRQLADAEKAKGTSLFVAVSGSGSDKTLFVVVSSVKAVPANVFAGGFGAQIGGKGGGRGDFAQGGGTSLRSLAQYVEIVEQVLSNLNAN